MYWFLIAMFVVLGACLGSFTTAITHRIQNGQSWIFQSRGQYARSLCPKCMAKLSAFDLIPIISWVFLLGKCRYCEQKISIRYPLIEITSAVISALAFVVLGVGLSLFFCLLLLPFVLAQFIIFYQKKFLSLQLCFIIISLLVLYMVVYIGHNSLTS